VHSLAAIGLALLASLGFADANAKKRNLGGKDGGRHQNRNLTKSRRRRLKRQPPESTDEQVEGTPEGSTAPFAVTGPKGSAAGRAGGQIEAKKKGKKKRGPTGPTGPTGPAGGGSGAGTTGPTGPAGTSGETGPTGPVGPSSGAFLGISKSSVTEAVPVGDFAVSVSCAPSGPGEIVTPLSGGYFNSTGDIRVEQFGVLNDRWQVAGVNASGGDAIVRAEIYCGHFTA